MEKIDSPNRGMLEDFHNTHNISIWANHHYYRTISDTTFFVLLSKESDSLFVINMERFSVRNVPLNSLKGKENNGIWAFYYHNHDSIFVFIDRYFILNNTINTGQKYNDIILLNGRGERINEYSLDSMPDIYNGTMYKKHYPWDQYIDERMFAGGILVDAIYKKPHVSECDFAELDPKILGLYDLKSRKIRMLNVRYPQEVVGNNYNVQPNLLIKKKNDNELLIGFATLPYVYNYNISKDTMTLIQADYDLHFINVDSASMKKGKDYVSICYKNPIWCPANSFYCRNLYVRYCKGYNSGNNFIEILDSNFNHVGYVSGNKAFSVECSKKGKIYAYEKKTGNQYSILLKNNKKRVDKTKFLQGFMEKIPPLEKEQISTIRYLEIMHIPDSSLTVIINLKYPCGECLEQLLTFYKKNQTTMESNRMYFIFYDPYKTNLTKELLKRYGLKNAPNILEDNKLLQKVNTMIPDMEFQNSQYIYMERHFNDGRTILFEPNIEQLLDILDKVISNL